jgi:transcriptional regulator with XRE-family HTH domain
MVDPGWIGGRIRELRDVRGWTREDLATAAGVSVRAIVQWERKEREPSWSNVLALAAALGVECTAFTIPPAERELPGRGRPKKAATEKEEKSTPKKRGRPTKERKAGDEPSK